MEKCSVMAGAVGWRALAASAARRGTRLRTVRRRGECRVGNDAGNQAGYLYRWMDEEQKRQLIASLASALKPEPKPVQMRKIGHFCKADPECGRGVAEALGIAMREIIRMTNFCS
ncbi:MAG TPA: catalase-related domain-containing protein [Gallionella sp.]|nr:catalase-related domain-containing protein [Gallionella sp.]